MTRKPFDQLQAGDIVADMHDGIAPLKARFDVRFAVQWRIGDPVNPHARGYVLRVIPPSYAERNAGRDRFNLDVIGVPCR